ncbi:MAG: nitrate reductase molybdenum cofactor assembly chaperone [Gaiellaceae bacterium]
MLRTLAALLSYPEVDDRAEVAAAAPPELRGWAERWAEADLQRVRRDYVATFDFSAAHALELTYRRYGDERERGRALLELKRCYREAGFEIEPGVLPDHLPLVLELCAEAPEAGRAILDEYRDELDGLRRALHESESDWAELLDVLAEVA